ncbi:MAG: sigma-70 family RNA polymerase sigma factor [Firmicutes bacterium]|nr:sigma-70 family RNA polymerase sigma factor [Bacillota bacterium]
MDTYKEDLEIARSVYRKFDCFRNLRDDLIQEALIKLWEFRNNEKKFFTFAGARRVANDAMVDFLRKESNHIEFDFSIFTPLTTDESKTYLDVLPDLSVDYEAQKLKKRIAKINYTFARNDILRVIRTFTIDEREIIYLFIKGHPYRDIAEQMDMSKSYVGKVVARFKNKVACALGISIDA